MEIAGRRIGPGQPVFVVAEMSANHNQRLDEALRIVHAAKEAGADAVKLQTYTADTMTIPSDEPPFRIGEGTIWEGKNLHELYEEAATPWEWQPRLKEEGERLGLVVFSTPFDATSVAFLEGMGVPCHKVASFEVVDLGLLEAIGRTGKPVIMSTGMATLAEIELGVETLRRAGAPAIALLKCTSAYPAPPDGMNLRTIPHLAEAFGVVAGLSDHTLGTSVPIAAVALGANIIEKHFTLSRAVPGPDSAFSLEPHEFKSMVDAVRTTERALGRVSYGVTAPEQASRVFRRSLFVVQDVRRGDPFTPLNVRCIRPGHGLAPMHLREVLARRAARDVVRGTPMSWDLLGGA